MTPSVINKVSVILFAVTGTGKAWVVRAILDPKTEAEECRVIWFLDRAATAELPIH
jgi:6-phosphogluconolactonase/glucosamine-6-phosphate isomerase/deaminase